MKRALFLLVAGLPALLAGDPALVENQVVYLLPMSNGFDQYLATELTRHHVLTITTDPKQATAVLTDRLGEPLELKLKEFNDLRAEATKPKDKGKEKDKEKDSGTVIIKNNLPPRVSSFGRGRGTVYLVDTRSRQVLWSIYARPANSTPSELNHTAEKVTKRLLKDATPNKGN